MTIAHSAMRRTLVRARLVLATPGTLTQQRRRAVAFELQWLVEFILHHHAGEDREIYPNLPADDPLARDLIRRMGEEHEVIHPPMDVLTDVAGRFADGRASASEVLAAITALEAPLLSHLAREEREAMPLVSRSVTHARWHEMERRAWVDDLSPAQRAAYGLWLVDSQTPDDAAIIMANVSKVQELALKAIFGGSYRRRRRRAWGGTPADAVPALSIEQQAAWPTPVSR
ncbi:hemerythrin domain-containing protein [Raineyella sp. LH-20]|uniref:hemerythrin domain-containing protein n=1 Tax=Raineyella sp. LH-20 TaxID=3081204 RepID=UPI0029554A64|nr:hemerythrin domain-containing protein [Raineyella sp. LH-20]WOP19971.1 hemerythrin domain-containing protein [Raineyella sp. LH-20]